MWTVKEAEEFWKSVVRERNEEIAELNEKLRKLEAELFTIKYGCR